MKTKLFSLALVALFAFGASITSLAYFSDSSVAMELVADGGCDKCKNDKCEGNCDATAKKCTEECKKEGKCTDECKKANAKADCAKSCEGKEAAKKSCEGKEAAAKGCCKK
jgi:hypothetical protein